MRKVLVFICCILLSIIASSLFGILHNQFTYTISDEFFTQVLFERFGFVEYGRNTPRLTASIIGVWSVWWIGLFTGLIFGFVGFFSSNTKEMIRSITGAIIIMLITTVIIGLLGLCYGFLGFSNLESNCCFPLQIKNVKNLISVSEMHSFSYAGGGIGAVIGVLWQIKRIKRNNKVRIN